MAKKVRKHYQKPNVNQVKLVIKEAVLSGCKTGFGAAGHTGRTCDTAPCRKGDYAS